MPPMFPLSSQATRTHLLPTATFGMGCFWKTEAFLGSLPGALGTRCGYSGGTEPLPTYRSKGSHIEMVEVIFEPEQITYPQLLQVFLANHKAERPAWKRGYASAIRTQNKEQLQQAKAALLSWKNERQITAQTLLLPTQPFYQAENRHQKYYLQRHPQLLASLAVKFGSFDALIQSTLAARLNGLLAGFGKKETLQKELENWNLQHLLKNFL